MPESRLIHLDSAAPGIAASPACGEWRGSVAWTASPRLVTCPPCLSTLAGAEARPRRAIGAERAPAAH